MIEIELAQADVDRCVAIGATWKAAKQSYATHEAECIAVRVPWTMGECAISQIIGVHVDWALRAQGDGGDDFFGVNVKTSRHLPPKLHLIVSPDDLRCDEYILVGFVGNRARIWGWATKADLLAHPTPGFGYGPRYAIEATKLRLDLSPRLAAFAVLV